MMQHYGPQSPCCALEAQNLLKTDGRYPLPVSVHTPSPRPGEHLSPLGSCDFDSFRASAIPRGFVLLRLAHFTERAPSRPRRAAARDGSPQRFRPSDVPLRASRHTFPPARLSAGASGVSVS